ncbi:thioredoxin domain-containing protein [Bacillus amyloliquefaciens]|nr:DUF255 domain-containing protein [Bacillus amyloliquefaciens]MEB4595238.1 thioredoxin domain-containing protein [Bacillus amyloliquefaciens]
MPNNSKPNSLITEKSPYLLQHAHTPINWHPWGEEAFEKAKRENKPILVIDSMSLSIKVIIIYLSACQFFNHQTQFINSLLKVFKRCISI